MPERAVLPKLLQNPHPSMRVSVTSPGTELDAAERVLGWLGVSQGHIRDQIRLGRTEDGLLGERGDHVPRSGLRSRAV